MPDLFGILVRWWKPVVGLAVITAVITSIVAWFIPARYSSVTTALPAPAYAADKGSVFSENLQELYAALGTPDDLDKIIGTAQLDTVYRDAVHQFSLAAHYGFERGGSPEERAVRLLRRRTTVIKTDYGELQVKCTDEDASMAAVLANAVMEKLQSIHQGIQNANNTHILERITTELSGEEATFRSFSDSMNRITDPIAQQLMANRKSAMLQLVYELQRLAGQYRLMVTSHPQSLIIVERASPSLQAAFPRKIDLILIATAIGLIFGFIVSLVLDRGRHQKALS